MPHSISWPLLLYWCPSQIQREMHLQSNRREEKGERRKEKRERRKEKGEKVRQEKGEKVRQEEKRAVSKEQGKRSQPRQEC